MFCIFCLDKPLIHLNRGRNKGEKEEQQIEDRVGTEGKSWGKIKMTETDGNGKRRGKEE